MASIRPATRYANGVSSPARNSDSEFTPPRDLAKKNDPGKINFGNMVKKLVDGKRTNKKFMVAADFLTEDLKNTARKAAGLGELHKKLFKGRKGSEEGERKALTELKGTNARTLVMVLRSERELLSKNREQEEEIAELKQQLEIKSGEVEKLKNLCLKQLEEIKSLKRAVLFPHVTNSHLQQVVEKQGSELNQAKVLIPSLQHQVASLTGQLRCLAADLAEVKADKYRCDNRFGTPKAVPYDEEDDFGFPVSRVGEDLEQDEMFINDLNPCLTPYNVKSHLG